MLAQRRRRRANIKSALDRYFPVFLFVFSGQALFYTEWIGLFYFTAAQRPDIDASRRPESDVEMAPRHICHY